MEQSFNSKTKKESEFCSINSCQSQIEGGDCFKRDKLHINPKEIGVTSEATQLNSYNDITTAESYSSEKCEKDLPQKSGVLTSVVGGFKHKYCVGGNNHVCGSRSSNQNHVDGKYFPVCSNVTPVNCDCPLGFHNHLCNQKRNEGHSSFYGMHSGKKRMKGFNVFSDESLDDDLHQEHIARNCVTCSAVSFFIPEAPEDGRVTPCLHVLNPSCKCCDTSEIQNASASSSSISQNPELSSNNSQLYGKVSLDMNKKDSSKKGAKKKIRTSTEIIEPAHDAGCGHWCNSCQAKLTDVKPESKTKEMKSASKSPLETANSNSMTLPAKPKHSLKAKLADKFLHNKNKQEGETSKHKRKNSLTNWFNCISLTNKISSNSNLTSSSKSSNILSSNRCNSSEESPNIELEHPQNDEDEASTLPKPTTGDKETVANDNDDSSTSSDEDFLNQPIVGPSNIRAPSVTGSVPLPFAYNSVLELHLLLERSLRLSILGNGSLQSDTDTSLSQGIHTQVDYIHCLVPDLLQVTNCSFYWGKMDRYEAEALLDNRPEGTFLLRDSAQDEYLFSVSFRRYGKSLHARIEQLNHKFSFDSLDPGVFASNTVCGLIEHYKDPSCCMFFEPMLTNPLPRSFPFPLQHLCRATICSSSTYNGISQLELPRVLKNYLKEYHYKQKVRVRRLDY